MVECLNEGFAWWAVEWLDNWSGGLKGNDVAAQFMPLMAGWLTEYTVGRMAGKIVGRKL